MLYVYFFCAYLFLDVYYIANRYLIAVSRSIFVELFLAFLGSFGLKLSSIKLDYPE